MSDAPNGRTVRDVLIVGAGQAGAQAAIALRQQGFDGSIQLLGDEALPPYERPPLSKDYLLGHKSAERLQIRPAAFWDAHAIALHTGCEVTAVHAQAHEVETADRRRWPYDRLVWATGGRPRPLTCTGATLAGVHTIRTLADVDRLRAALPAVERVVIIGGGYIGLEAAAVLRALGKAVDLVEAQDRVLARSACPLLSRFLEDEHRRHGVTLHLGMGVAALEGDGHVQAVRLADGTRLACESVIVGIGITPTVAPLQAAGAACSDGVLVDAACATSLPDVFAIGDCTVQQHPQAHGAWLRIESVQNAADQALTVARTLRGQSPAPAALPWFWSNQYDLRLQTAGLSIGYDRIELRGRLEDRSFSIDYFRQDQRIAVDCLNAPRDYMAARKALAQSGVTA